MSDDLRTRLAAMAEEWTKGLDVDEVHPTDATRRIVADVRALLAEPAAGGEDHPPCCPSCEGRGGTSSGPCWDCRGTGHAHAPTPAQPAAPSGDVEAVLSLADALRDAGVEVGYVGGDPFRQAVANRLLRSDWLATHDAEVRASAARETAERITGAIEAATEPVRVDDIDAERGRRIGMLDAARIARAEGDR